MSIEAAVRPRCSRSQSSPLALKQGDHKGRTPFVETHFFPFPPPYLSPAGGWHKQLAKRKPICMHAETAAENSSSSSRHHGAQERQGIDGSPCATMQAICTRNETKRPSPSRLYRYRPFHGAGHTNFTMLPFRPIDSFQVRYTPTRTT